MTTAHSDVLIAGESPTGL